MNQKLWNTIVELVCNIVIKINEFYMLMMDREAIELLPSREEYKRLFRALDDDRNGKITPSELKDTMFYLPSEVMDLKTIQRLHSFWGVKGM